MAFFTTLELGKADELSGAITAQKSYLKSAQSHSRTVYHLTFRYHVIGVNLSFSVRFEVMHRRFEGNETAERRKACHEMLNYLCCG